MRDESALATSKSWCYPETADDRDLRIDLMRGIVMFILIMVHQIILGRGNRHGGIRASRLPAPDQAPVCNGHRLRGTTLAIPFIYE
jgi:hypothetical protein